MIGRRTTRIGLLIATLAVLAAVSTADAAELVSVPQADWGCELSDEKIVQGINAGLISKDWVITKRDTKGHLVAEIIVRSKHTLTVDIAYTNTTFQITYKSSEDLNYKIKNGVPEIHTNANRWLKNIQNEMRKQLGALCTL